MPENPRWDRLSQCVQEIIWDGSVRHLEAYPTRHSDDLALLLPKEASYDYHTPPRDLPFGRAQEIARSAVEAWIYVKAGIWPNLYRR